MMNDGVEKMADSDLVEEHYTHGRLLDAIASGVERLGKSSDTVSIADLAPVDEFHIGGRAATESFLDQIRIAPDDLVLDVGCGLGGASRFVAQRYGCRVTGIDLTREYIDTGNVLCAWVGLDGRISLEQGNATALSHPSGQFDKAYMMHVGMNIADKQALAAEVYRVLRPGGIFGIYDVMRVGSAELILPVPWATTAEANALSEPGEYKDALRSAGFHVVAERNRREFALEFFASVQAASAAAQGPPPLGMHILMGETAPIKVKNMIENIMHNCIAPVELISEKMG